MTRGLMIAAPRSGSGKTTATLGLLRAFRRRGVDVVGLKSGPRLYRSGLPCRGVGAGRRQPRIPGPWRPTFSRRSPRRRRADARLRCAKPRWVSLTASRARPGAPAPRRTSRRRLACRSCSSSTSSGQAQSAAAIVKGCALYDERLKVAGVIVNRVGSERHRRLVVEAIEAMGVPVVGALPRNDKRRAARAPSGPRAGGRDRGARGAARGDRRFRRDPCRLRPRSRAR